MATVSLKQRKNLFFMILIGSYGLVACSRYSLAVLIVCNLINIRMLYNLVNVSYIPMVCRLAKNLAYVFNECSMDKPAYK